MIIREFYDLEELEDYYDEKSNTYVINENDVPFIDLVVFGFDLNVKANIRTCGDIRAENIDVLDIKASNIEAENINAENIDYYAVCFAYGNIKCKSIQGRVENAKHFVLDGTLEVEEDDK